MHLKKKKDFTSHDQDCYKMYFSVSDKYEELKFSFEGLAERNHHYNTNKMRWPNWISGTYDLGPRTLDCLTIRRILGNAE